MSVALPTGWSEYIPLKEKQYVRRGSEGREQDVVSI